MLVWSACMHLRSAGTACAGEIPCCLLLSNQLLRSRRTHHAFRPSAWNWT